MKCPECLCENNEVTLSYEHICPPYLKAMVAKWKQQHPGKDITEEISVQETL